MDEKKILIDELFSPAYKHFPRRHVVQKSIDNLWECDLIQMTSYGTDNDGFNYILVAIDIFSKYAFAKGIRNKSGIEVTKAMDYIFKKEGRVPKLMHYDEGKEFLNKHFQALLKTYGIKGYITYSAMKSSIIERFIKTIKIKLFKKFALAGKYRWVEILDETVDEYNNSYHRTIKTKPRDVNNPTIERKLLKTVYNYDQVAKNKNGKRAKPKFSVGQLVRISKYRSIFSRSFHSSWSFEVFRISAVNHTNPITYELKDLNNEKIIGCFYQQEILPTVVPDIYLIEKILKQQGNRVLVKFLGFDEPSYIKKSQIL